MAQVTIHGREKAPVVEYTSPVTVEVSLELLRGSSTFQTRELAQVVCDQVSITWLQLETRSSRRNDDLLLLEVEAHVFTLPPQDKMALIKLMIRNDKGFLTFYDWRPAAMANTFGYVKSNAIEFKVNAEEKKTREEKVSRLVGKNALTDLLAEPNPRLVVVIDVENN